MRTTGKIAFFILVTSVGCAMPSDSLDDEQVGESEDALTCQGPRDCPLPNPAGTDRDRAENPVDGSRTFPLKSGSHLYDGLGHSRGAVHATRIAINYGQRKEIGGDVFVYAFGPEMSDGSNMSGWVRQSNVGDHVSSMNAASLDDPGEGDYEADFTVSGGVLSKYGDLKVVPDDSGSHRQATDYLVRPGEVFNLLYNLPGAGGVSNDTLPIGVHFRRSKGVSEVEIPVYHPGGHAVVGHMPFVYGHVGSRYGWIARDALTD